MKKVWKKPQLIVLYRARPEENVLAICKGVSNSPAGPGFSKKCKKGNIYCSDKSAT
jgi:hypothetical protein